ncbi:Hsp70 family protein [Micromonospora thermarum]|uniref:Hsp70 family protein n=1 Tax=Micromonospora thermarum TaxID=2720024 RepID=A0ABX0Z068_9ACTN|nr:Hsp70 family protein [Micromonospora thermarum]NJP30774.1 Hsp70 family protein [Micromonospora thermarum]
MPSGGARLSIDLSSPAIAATVDRHGARIPVMLDGRLAMPRGVALDPAGNLYLGVPSANTPPPGHQFVPDPLDLLGTTDTSRPVDAVEVLATLLRHVTGQAAKQVGEPIVTLTLTIPSSWGPRRRDQLIEAASRAGISAPTMVTAPAALAAHAQAHGLTAPDGSCLLICQAGRHPVTLTVLQVNSDGYRELATRAIDPPGDLNQVLAQRIVEAATAHDDPLRVDIADQTQDGRVLLESVRQARQLLATQDRAPVLLPAPRTPTVITRDDVATATQPLLDTVHDAVRDTLDTADINPQHLAGVILRETEPIPGLHDRLTTATGLAPAVLRDQSHVLADGALALTAPHHDARTAADSHLPRVRLRVRDLTSATVLTACSLALLLQAVLTADITTVEYRIIGVRTSLPQLGTAGALAMLTAFAVAHLAPTTWLAGTPTTPTPEPATGSLIRRGYLAAAVGGAIAAALYGLATGTSVGYDYSPYLRWTLGSALPLAVCATVIAATAPRIPATDLPTWLKHTRPAVLHAAIATAGIYLMRAALTITPPVDWTGMPGLIGSTGAALLGIATAMTATRSRTIRTITAPGLAIGYAIVFTSNTSGALTVGYLIAVTWWSIRLAGHTLRLAFPAAGAALRRLTDGRSD